MKVVYVAGKFTAATPWETEQNVRRAEAVGLEVAELGAAPMIPHSNTRFFVGTCTPEFWYAATLALLLKCDAVVMVPGWEASKGATAEMAAAVAAGIPVFHDLASVHAWLHEDECPHGLALGDLCVDCREAAGDDPSGPGGCPGCGGGCQVACR